MSSRSEKEISPVAHVIDRFYSTDSGVLLVGGVPVSALTDQYSSPLFVYDKSVILQKISDVRSTLNDRFQLYYSIKANPNAALLKCFLEAGCGLEVASGGELFQAIAAGSPPERILFAGPGKTETELASAVDASIGEIHVESIGEARSLNQISAEKEVTTRVALRVNPVDTSGGAMRMCGQPSQFGIDEEELEHAIEEIKELSNLEVRGVHIFMGTQILDAEVLVSQYRRAISVAGYVAKRLGPLATIDFGGGWGTPYFAHEQELDLNTVAEGVAEIERELSADPNLKNTTAIVEPGRFLINEAGVYLARVTRVKHSRGKTFVVIDGGMHHHLAASGNLGQTIKRNYPMAIVNKLDQPPCQKVDVVGSLCTPLDTLGRGVLLPNVEPGDLVGIFMSGAYARASSPLGFLSHESPAEVIIEDGTPRLVRRRGSASDYLRDQIPDNSPGDRSS
jgi:diaminopimelate decarboxylase